MDHWFRPVHRSTVTVLAAAGYAVAVEPAPPCCGALHLHSGRRKDALRLARSVVDAYRRTEGPIVVNSAGCGAVLKEYGRLLGTPDAFAFASRVVDFSEVVDIDSLPPLGEVRRTVAYQRACHLTVQRLGDRTQQLLGAIPGLTVVETDDGGLCCGAGGMYSLTQPVLSEAILDMKTRSVEHTGCRTVAVANPGCALHLARRGFSVVHPAQLLAAALAPAGSPKEVPR